MIARVAGAFLRALLGVRETDVSWSGDEPPWTFAWGSAAYVLLTPLPPDRHEFADRWFVLAQPMARQDDLALLLAVVLAATSGLIYDGAIVDEQGMLGEAAATPAAVLDCALVHDARAASDVLAALRSP